MGGGGGGSTTTSGIDPTIKPYVTYGLEEAKRQYQAPGAEFYPGQTYVSPTEATQSALQMAQTRAMQGSPITAAAQQQQLQAIQSGGGVNPYLAQNLEAAYRPTVQAAQESVRGLQSNASRAGRYGSDAMAQLAQRGAEGVGTGIGGQLSNLAYTSSEAQAGRAQSAAQNAPQMAAADYADIQKLLTVGQAQESYQQKALQDSINRYNYEQTLPQQKLQQFTNLFTSVPSGGTSTTTQQGGK